MYLKRSKNYIFNKINNPAYLVKDTFNSSFIFSKSICFGAPYIKICKTRVNYIRYICKWEEVNILRNYYKGPERAKSSFFFYSK